MNYTYHFEESIKRRDAFWEGIGAVHPDVLSHAVNPAFMGGPKWPSLRQAFKKIDTNEITIIASDGLSDPYSTFDSNPEVKGFNGLGCEFYLECDEKLTDIGALSPTWQFNVLYQAAQFAAGNPNVLGMIQQHTWVSLELYDCKVPPEFVSPEERSGILIGLESAIVPKEVELSLEKIRLVNVKLLTLSELSYLQQNGNKGRQEVAQKILAQAKASRSFLSREPVV
ncbi:MAG: hypothetical protein AAGA10_30505 [Bacteroidota bacterium]